MKILLAFGTAIKRARKKADLSLPDLAIKASISKGGLSRIERGLTDPQLTTIVKIADALGIRADALVSKCTQ